MPVLCVDVSENQPVNLPWPEWKAAGLGLAITRSSIGIREDTNYVKHREHARAAGLLTTEYHALLHHDAEIAFFDPARQAETFVSLFIPGWRGPAWVDVEAAGITEPFLRAFVERYESVTTRALGIYTSAAAWNRLIHGNHARYHDYFAWIADYGDGMVTSVPLKPGPDMPDTWADWLLYQFAGDNGRMKPYAGKIDLSLYSGTALDLAALWLSIGDEPMDDQLVKLIQAETGKIAASVQAINAALAPVPVPVPPPVLPWWQKLTLPAVHATAVPGKVLLFRDAAGGLLVPNPRTSPITYSLDVFAVNVDLRLVRVTDFQSSTKKDWFVSADDLLPAG
jgi:GH25 family lysozyme M1 (1,4-beta-N-acetylmuramidase)